MASLEQRFGPLDGENRQPPCQLLVERRGFLADGRAVEFSQSFYRGDAYDFVAELGELG